MNIITIVVNNILSAVWLDEYMKLIKRDIASTEPRHQEPSYQIRARLHTVETNQVLSG
jgi:hypothetical protein